MTLSTAMETQPKVRKRSFLRGLASAPVDTADLRAFLQQRVAMLARVLIVMVFGFQLLARVVNYRSEGMLARAIGSLVPTLQLSMLGVFVALWLRVRRGERSIRELRVYDAAVAILPTWVLGVSLSRVSVLMRPELLLLVATVHLLMARAIIVPSSPRRTFVVGLSTLLPGVIGTYLFYSDSVAPTALPPWMYASVMGAWSTASVVISSLASYTIFGLRERVREASQLGQYILESKLGEGGMGVVYRARHAMLRRPTAVKLLLPDKASERDLARFEREVQLTSELTHPNTISIFDYGRTPGGTFYYAMEFLDGIDLQGLVECCGPQPPECVVHVLAQVAGALAEAHRAGLIHRDIKPANVLLCERGGLVGVAKVVDFGLVKSLNSGEHDSMLSGANTIMGTPLYLSPEAIARPNAVDARSDLYALGAVAYFLLVGEPPFVAKTIVEVCGHHLHTPPVPPSARLGRAVPADLEALVLTLLAKDPAARPASAQALERELRSLSCRTSFEEDAARAWWNDVLARREIRKASRTSLGPPIGSRTMLIDWEQRRPAVEAIEAE